MDHVEPLGSFDKSAKLELGPAWRRHLYSSYSPFPLFIPTHNENKTRAKFNPE
jgi:hypothetical protein